MEKNKRIRKRTKALLAVLAGTGILNVLSWRSTAFSDWYLDHLFPFVSAPLAWFSNLFPFSIGEWMLAAAVVWIVILIIVLFVLAVRGLIAVRRRIQHGTHNGEKPIVKQTPLFFRKFLYVTLWIVVIVFFVMTLNCVILYHASPLERQLPGYGKEYSIGELADLRDEVVENCNRLARMVPRDSSGEVLYAGGHSAMGQKARQAVAEESGLEGDSIPVLKRLCGLRGWSVTPKGLLASGFVSQQYMQGYYFPFSMEANYNTVMKIMNVPFTMCHEISHTHGFIYEDEANLIGFLACIHSDDPVFQYSGWLGVLNYVNNSFYENVDEAEYRSHPSISKQVLFDNEFLSEESWKEVEENAIVSTETAKAATDVYLDSTLKANGISSGKASYSHVVGLMLEYFDNSF